MCATETPADKKARKAAKYEKKKRKLEQDPVGRF